MLENDDFAAILLDVKMPEMDGFEIAELIRTRRNNRHTPILFLTAFPNDDHLFRGYDLKRGGFPVQAHHARDPAVEGFGVRGTGAQHATAARENGGPRTRRAQVPRAARSRDDALFIIRGDGDIVLVNSHTKEMFHYERRDLLGRNLSTLIPDWHPGSRMAGAAEFTAVARAANGSPSN